MGTQVLDPVMPSAFTYKDRCAIQRDSTSEYNRLYTTPSNNVWERLTYDASFRCARTQSAKPYREGAHVPSATGTLSGFASNSTNPSATYTVDSFKPTLQARNDNVMVESLHPLVAKRFKQKEPIQFLMAIRPDTETTNQTMRMMGTYHSDLDQARRFGMHIPAGSPGGAGWYHPDVVLTERRVQTHPAWATATHGAFGFSTNGRFDPTNMGQRASLHINMDKARPQSAPRAAQQASSPAAAANGSTYRPVSAVRKPAPGLLVTIPEVHSRRNPAGLPQSPGTERFLTGVLEEFDAMNAVEAVTRLPGQADSGQVQPQSHLRPMTSPAAATVTNMPAEEGHLPALQSPPVISPRPVEPTPGGVLRHANPDQPATHDHGRGHIVWNLDG